MQFSYKSVLLVGLFFIAGGCSDLPTPPSEGDVPRQAWAHELGQISVTDVPAVNIDLPPEPREWDLESAALADALAEAEGFAVVAFKAPGSERALQTGRRAAVSSGTIRTALSLLDELGVEVIEYLHAIGAARVQIDPDKAVELATNDLIDFIEPRQEGRILSPMRTAVSADLASGVALSQTIPWGLDTIRAPEAWDRSRGAAASIEVIDTGHDRGHEDLPLVPTANCSGIYDGCSDTNGHGTHVLGIAAARDNSLGIIGVAPDLTSDSLYSYGACDSSGVCPTDEVTAGINSGVFTVGVMNLSLRQPYDAAQANAVAQAWNNDIVLVAAAGNNGGNTVVYPAAYTDVVGVSGVYENGTFAEGGSSTCSSSSNYGSHVAIAAPFSALSTTPSNGYTVFCGTSMAAPHVTGAVALMRDYHRTWSNADIVNELLATADDRGVSGRDDRYGHGLLDAAAAVGIARPVPLTAEISGPGFITSEGYYTWEAMPDGGEAPYTYSWEINYYEIQDSWGNLAGDQKDVTFYVSGSDGDFKLRVTVTSSDGQEVQDLHFVTNSSGCSDFSC